MTPVKPMPPTLPTPIADITFDSNGLIPVIAQDAHDQRVLMLAYANREAIERTLTTGQAHYWSRSRNALWHKGETSGNTQRVIRIEVDCDRDALIYHVEQTGTGACHRGSRSCFD
jgi:phosphoribosyl-AMP cyclohydrolase